MNDAFAVPADDVMIRANDSASSTSTAAAAPASSTSLDAAKDGHVCPFCGLMREITEDFDPSTPCPRCTLADTPTTRNATKARIGPWHVRQVRNPWAPGMRFETLLALVKRGQVTKDSIVRGPTSHQLWKRASEIKGLSREFGVCYSCGGEIDAQANLCPSCNRLQEPPANPDVLVEAREMAPPPPPPAPSLQLSQPAAIAPPSLQQRQPRGGSRSEHPFDAPAHIDIGSGPGAAAAAMADPDEMLAADSEQELAMARQLTARPPIVPPHAAPLPTPAPAPAGNGNGNRAPRPMRPRPAGGPDDALLTPQELAAAFQLDFKPVAPPPAAKKKRALALVLVLIVGPVAALLALRPDYREQATGWVTENYAAAKAWLASRSQPAIPPMPPRPGAAKGPSAARGDAGDAAAPAATKPKSQEPIVIAPPPMPPPRAVAVSETPLAAPAVPAPSPAKQMETPVRPPSPPAAPASAARPPALAPEPARSPPTELVVVRPPANPSAPAAAAPAPTGGNAKQASRAQLPPGDPEEQARILRLRAIDAEDNQDFREAVNLYELIKKLPADVQPRDIDIRLEQAKKMLK